MPSAFSRWIPPFVTDHPALPTSVLYNALPLTSVAAASGVGSYVRNLLGALSERVDVDIVAMSESHLELPEGTRRLPVRRLAQRPRLRVMEEAARTPIDVFRRRPNGAVFHNTDFHAPPMIKAPWVQTLFDVIPLVHDHADQKVLRARWKRFGPRYRYASAVVAISKHAAAEGIRLLGLNPARVHVAHLGVDPAFGPAEPTLGTQPYLLMVSEFSRYKGFEEAFSVMDELADAGYPHHLVVAGRLRDESRDRLFALRAASRHPERIDVRGFVPDLVELYQQASAYLMASRYEGFGLPTLEAMASGAPVVAFSNSAVTEVVREGGHLIEDGDVRAMTAAVRQLLDSPDCAQEWRQRGLAHVRTFTWEACASIHADVYRSVAESAAP
jgi:glycosyltransferase involved in cell wall biosynthesis